MTQTANLATVSDITTALTAKNLPNVGKDAIGVIGRHGREAFLNSLSLLMSGQDEEGKQLQFLQGLLCCLTPEAQAALQAMGLTPSLDDLVQTALRIAARTPARLASAIAAGHDPAHPSHNEAKEYLKAIFAPPPPPPASAAAPAPPPEPPQAPQPQSAAPVEPRETKQKFRSAHVYGGNYALCFNAGVDRDQRPGMMVDAAVSSGPRTYDWANAIHIWLDEREIASALSVFRRWRSSVEFNAHGPANDKSFFIEFQRSHFFCKVSATKLANDKARAVKIMPLDANKVSILFLEQLLLAYPNVPPAEVLEQVRIINEQGQQEAPPK